MQSAGVWQAGGIQAGEALESSRGSGGKFDYLPRSLILLSHVSDPCINPLKCHSGLVLGIHILRLAWAYHEIARTFN